MAKPIPRTKAGKQAKVKRTLDEWKAGTLRSGSKKGPIVKSQRQAVAIALQQSGQGRKRKKK
jgi:hypothetical protein